MAMFREKNGLDSGLGLLSDPQLEVAGAWQVKTATKHPKALFYPRRAFLQPAVLVFDREGAERFAWRSRPRLFNLFGAARRMTPQEVLERVLELM